MDGVKTRNVRPMVPPKVPQGGVLLGAPVPNPAVGTRRPFTIVLNGVTDGWATELHPVMLRGVSALEAQALIAEAAFQRTALNLPVAQMHEDGRITLIAPKPPQTAPQTQPQDQEPPASTPSEAEGAD